MATVVLLGTLDTKGDEYDFLRRKVREEGVDVLLVDTGVLGVPLAEPDISRQEVAAAAGANAEDL
ncbi:MAG TPA: Tm-1-like ATP-binding domain-containing protein, partial [Gaiellaceae bacterium]|nr:Tm-1-like ATP-binding domain-containing protein [Gaiellaceae bacterium]